MTVLLTFLSLAWYRARFYWETRRDVYMNERWLFERMRSRSLD